MRAFGTATKIPIRSGQLKCGRWEPPLHGSQIQLILTKCFSRFLWVFAICGEYECHKRTNEAIRGCYRFRCKWLILHRITCWKSETWLVLGRRRATSRGFAATSRNSSKRKRAVGARVSPAAVMLVESRNFVRMKITPEWPRLSQSTRAFSRRIPRG